MVKTRQFLMSKTALLLMTCVASGNIARSDWLVTQIEEPVKIEKILEGKEIVISNGLISRTIRLQPNAATIGYDNLMTGESIIRGVKAEAIVELNGQKYEVGWP